MNLDPFGFVVIAVATWRVSHLFAVEHGPGHIFARFRSLLGVREATNGTRSYLTFWAGLVGCVLCLSVWLAPLFLAGWILAPFLQWGIIALALSGVASALELFLSKG